VPDAIDVEIRGLEETQKKAEQLVREIFGPPMLDAMRDATLYVVGDAKKLAPVDTGRLRASITPAIRSSAEGIQGVIGSNVHYAPYMELGTRPHWPPLGALETWAKRHGTTAFQVARAIATRGTKARRFLQGAVEQNAPKIYRRIEIAVRQIINK